MSVYKWYRGSMPMNKTPTSRSRFDCLLLDYHLNFEMHKVSHLCRLDPNYHHPDKLETLYQAWKMNLLKAAYDACEERYQTRAWTTPEYHDGRIMLCCRFVPPYSQLGISSYDERVEQHAMDIFKALGKELARMIRVVWTGGQITFPYLRGKCTAIWFVCQNSRSTVQLPPGLEDQPNYYEPWPNFQLPSGHHPNHHADVFTDDDASSEVAASEDDYTVLEDYIDNDPPSEDGEVYLHSVPPPPDENGSDQAPPMPIYQPTLQLPMDYPLLHPEPYPDQHFIPEAPENVFWPSQQLPQDPNIFAEEIDSLIQDTYNLPPGSYRQLPWDDIPRDWMS
ncbi:hypothetical protein BO70DRAFT_415354 [Aspergillus heteromorphus CBS 117.55]|uniref:Uncharacterized protein n=1 Tax=Aspergillus heteromorphus CBS 117.55 TaxID=1448321 RepID=A0A317WVS5_9EURO|nr:uncharacterized protein BO70DRAFT_415354 [Aspergillus heteromorphus CBS 117.55]PWY89941.1 hypothetical protein BO70DRAFT_415354 [Aspergillus heteromorphus CBS 117.55]